MIRNICEFAIFANLESENGVVTVEGVEARDPSRVIPAKAV